MFVALLLVSIGAEPTPRFTVTNKVAPKFTVVNKVTPAPPVRAIGTREFWNGFGWVEWSGTGWVQVSGAPAVAPQPFRGGCGCTPSANCGAAFCKSRGGTGCPQSCPIK